jgi:hypothetical protein
MNTREIEALLEKYYEGETTLGEEQALKVFFSDPGVPDHLAVHRSFFTGLKNEAERMRDEQGFDARMDSLLAERRDEQPVIPLQTKRVRMFFYSGLAAAILLMIGLFTTLRQDILHKNQPVAGTGNTEMAYAQAKEALTIVSCNLNRGLGEINRLEAVDKAMEKIELFNKFYQYQSIIINPDMLDGVSQK